MTEAKSYYVYSLKDPTTNPAAPFYVGKGTGVRAWEHELSPDNSAKGLRLKTIAEAQNQVLVTKLVDHLTELEAFRIEAELISAFGTLANGGLLTNVVTPKLEQKSGRARNVIVLTGVPEKAQLGLRLLEAAVLELAVANGQGVTNSDVAHSLGLQSDYLGGSKDYLSWSVLGLLMRDGKMVRVDKKRHKAQVR